MSMVRVVLCKVVRVSQSPMNAQRWALDLACGHEEWVTRKRKPTMSMLPCSKCKEKGGAKP